VEFFNQATQMKYAQIDSPFVVLMLCSYKVYKGIEVFVNLAKRLGNVQFVMVLSTSEEEVALFCKAVKCPSNCEVLPARELPITLFSRAHLVVNLSLPHLFIETFGLTLLEAMACGRPVIAPPVGGPVEFVRSGVNGFMIDSRQIEQLENQIVEVSADYNSYLALAKNARLTAENYSFGKFSAKIKYLIESSAFIKGGIKV
jgi:glycosyltransferase involved in cell wall biosynthesis